MRASRPSAGRAAAKRRQSAEAEAHTQAQLQGQLSSALRETAELRDQALRQAREALELRDRFLVLAAHELRTPVTSVRGYSQILLRQLERTGGLDPALARRGLQIIDHQSDRLTHLVAQLLDFARLQSGGLTLARRATDLVPLICRAVSRVQSFLALAGQIGGATHDLRVQAPEAAWAMVDPDRFEQVIANLLDNAVRYSPDGGVIDVEVGPGSAGTVAVGIRDHGIGVPPELRERVFEQFFQVKSEGSPAGMGMGLYLSRYLAEMHGGAIRLESPPDGGSRFVVEVPAATPRSAVRGAEASSSRSR
jgi:signal transduction histidine kinase